MPWVDRVTGHQIGLNSVRYATSKYVVWQLKGLSGGDVQASLKEVVGNAANIALYFR
jgi:hypothetical protein